MSVEEQKRLERFQKYHPPHFYGGASEDAQGFLDQCHHILHAMGLFTDLFLRKFIPHTRKDELHTKFELLRQGSMVVSEYAMRFVELSHHAPTLVSTVRERVRRFIEGLADSLRFGMERELDTLTSFNHVVEIVRRLKRICRQEKGCKEAKRPRGFGGFSSSHYSVTARHGRGFDSRPIQSVLQFLVVLQLARDPKTVTLAMPELPRLELKGSLGNVPSGVVSFLKAQRMVENEWLAYLAFVRDVSVDTPTVESVPVVREFLDVFPVDLPGKPPDRDIDFGIDLVPGT
ncbi:uncharacterized protein [Nicotiana tomentosiformis]|uniref:uncharacterized protein n=1 Tax=Nicotiana tomentosiformis TaxID=4098 RepID=UPI00388C4608